MQALAALPQPSPQAHCPGKLVSRILETALDMMMGTWLLWRTQHLKKRYLGFWFSWSVTTSLIKVKCMLPAMHVELRLGHQAIRSRLTHWGIGVQVRATWMKKPQSQQSQLDAQRYFRRGASPISLPGQRVMRHLSVFPSPSEPCQRAACTISCNWGCLVAYILHAVSCWMYVHDSCVP